MDSCDDKHVHNVNKTNKNYDPDVSSRFFGMADGQLGELKHDNDE